MTNFILKIIIQGIQLLQTCIFHCPFYVAAVLMAYTAEAAGCQLFLKQSTLQSTVISFFAAPGLVSNGPYCS